MLSFYPGPSKVHPKSLDFIQEAYQKGIVSINHRSKTFQKLYQETEENLKFKWSIPKDYSIYFISSATEAWEIVSHSVVRKQAAHFYSGAFGQKWASYSNFWNPNSIEFSFSPQESIENFLQHNQIDYSQADTICLVHSETSNGTIQEIKRVNFEQNPEAILAVDATSSMAGMALPWLEADIWFASVQKCMGLPAGMGLLICSPNALARSKENGPKNLYNHLLFLEENRKKYQTHFTPNVLAIYVLNQLTQYLPPLMEIHEQTLAKAQFLTDYFEKSKKKSCDFLINEPGLRLPTVFALKGTSIEIENLLLEAEKKGLILGKGYGTWANSSFRIANFPSHTWENLHELIHFLTDHGF